MTAPPHLRRYAAAFGLLVATAPAARAQSARPSSATATPTLAGAYALQLIIPGEQNVPFTVVVADTSGRWSGYWTSPEGRTRLLGQVSVRPDSSRLTVQYVDGAGAALLTLRVQGDSVRGQSEYGDGTFQVIGKRTAVPPVTRR